MFLLYIFLPFCFTVTLSSSEEVTSGIEEEHHHHSSSTTEMNIKDDIEIFNGFFLHHEEATNNLNDSLHSEVQENNGVISAEQATIENIERLFENEINESSIENGEKREGENVQNSAITTKESVSRESGEDTCKTKDETEMNKNETHSSPITRQNNEYVQSSQYITKASIKEPVTNEFNLKADVDFSPWEHADETHPGGESKASASPESETTEEAATEKQEDKDEKTEERNKIDKTAHISVDKHFKSMQGNVKIGAPEHHSSDTSEFASRYSTEPFKESVETRTVEHSLSAWGEHESTFPSIETLQGIGSQECDAGNNERTEHHNHSSEIIQEGEFSTTTIVEEPISSKSSTKLGETTSNMSQFEHQGSKDENSFLEPGNSRHNILKGPGYYSNTLEVTQQSERIFKEPDTGSNEEANFSECKSHSECHGVTSTTIESNSKENTEESGFPSTKTLIDSTTEVIGFSEVHSSTIEELEEKSEEIEISISVKKSIKSISKSNSEAAEDQDSDHESKDFIQSFPNIIEETRESESIEKISGKIHDTFYTSKNNEVLEDVEFSPTSEAAEKEETVTRGTTLVEELHPKEPPSDESLILWREPFSIKNLAISEEEDNHSNIKASKEESHYKETTPSEVLGEYSESFFSKSLIGKAKKEETSLGSSETELNSNDTFTKSSEFSSGDSLPTYNYNSIEVQKKTKEKFSSIEFSITTEQMEHSISPSLSLRISSETGKKLKTRQSVFYYKKPKKLHIFKPVHHLHSNVKIEEFFLGLGTTPCKYCHHEHKKSTTRINKWQASGKAKQHKISMKTTKIPKMVEKHTKKSEISLRKYFDEILTTIKTEKNFVEGETTRCEYCKSSTKKPKIFTRTAGKVSKIPEKHAKNIESITHKPSSSNGFLTTVKIENIFVGGEILCEYCKNSKTLQETESHKHRIDTESFQERRSTASELEVFKNTKEMKKHRESYSTHELVATEESSESATMEPLTQSSGHEPASHKEPIKNQEEKFEETISPTTHKLKKLTQRVQTTPKTYDNEKKVSEATKELQRKIETSHEIGLYESSETHELVTTNSAIHPRNILISNYGIEPPQNSNSNMNKIEIMYKALNRHEDESTGLTHYTPRVSQSHPKTCTKRDFGAGIHCFCNISKYLHTLQTRVLKMEQIKSTAHYCESFFQTDLLEMKKSSNSRRCRTSIINFESSMRQRATQLEFDSIDGVFESDFTLPLKGKTLYRLPTESVTIHCGNDSIKELIEAPVEEELAFIWTFKPSSSTIAEELSTKNNKLIIHRISPKNAGNYTCSLTNKHSVMIESWHKLEVLNFPIYEIQLNIFYRINDSCSIKTGEDLKYHMLKLLGPILCSDKREICNLKVDNPRCLTREEGNYYNITIHVKSNPDMVYFLQSECSINCKFSFYENLVHMVYKNAEVFEHTNVSMFSDINQLHEIMFTPHHSTANGYTVTTKLPKIIVTCPAGYGLESTKQRVCVVCPRNTYSKNNNSFCKMCPEGNYQPDPGSESCIKCSSPVDASVCLRILYTDTNLFKVYIGAFLGVVAILAIILVIWLSGLKNKLHDGKVDPLSLAHEETNQPLSPDIERGYCECLSKTAAPQIPPVDF